MHLYQLHNHKIGAHKHNIAAQRPAHHGRTEACPLWAHRSLPTLDAKNPEIIRRGSEYVGAQMHLLNKYIIIKAARASTKWPHSVLPTMGARKPAQHGCTEACPLRTHGRFPTLGAQKPAHHGRTKACTPWAHKGLPTLGAQMPAHHERTEARPFWAHIGLPTMGAQMPAHFRRTDACSP